MPIESQLCNGIARGAMCLYHGWDSLLKDAVVEYLTLE